jgi:hypothetical protein
MIRRAVLAVLAPGDPVTFPELGDRLAARGVEVDGDQTLALAQDPAVVLWSRWRPEVVDVVVELVAAGQVVLEPCRPERYNGARLDLPWRRCAARRPRCPGRVGCRSRWPCGAATGWPTLARVRAWWP